MGFPRLLGLLLSSIFPPRSPAQSPLVPMSEEEGPARSKQMGDGANEEERGDDDPEGEGYTVAGLAHGMDGQITGDPVVGVSVGGRTGIGWVGVHRGNVRDR